MELYKNRPNDLEQAKESSEKYKEISDILSNKETDARKLRARANRTNFNTALLDKLWILCVYKPIFEEFKQKIDGQMSIRLLSGNGTEIVKKSGSQETLMYISILFAIRDFTQRKREESYPLIFDA